MRLICSGGRGEAIFTPRLAQAGVDGIMRRYLLAQLAQAGYDCQQVEASRSAVLSADEVVICNALMPVLPVRQIDDVTFSARTLYQQLRRPTVCQTMEAS